MKTLVNSMSTLLVALTLCVSICAAPKPKKELYVPMDYSTCGYHASELAIPRIGGVMTVAWQAGDCSQLIQQAIDRVSLLKPDRNGHRGAVVLGEGVFDIATPLRITVSGVTLRGAGRGKTVLRKLGADRGAAIYVEGSSVGAVGDTIALTDAKVRAGDTSLTLAQTGMLQTGSRILIVRPSTAPWIASLRMNDFGGGLDYTGWKPSDIDIEWDRTVTAVSGNRITIDAPITTTLSAEYGGGFIVSYAPKGELTECGIENLTIESAVDGGNPKDEDHCWDGIFMEHVRDCWVRRVDFRHLAGSAVNLQKHTSRITVEDCIASEPVSEIGGWRRQVFLTRGQQTLFQRCVSRHGIHDFAAGFCAAGPNAFVQCEGEESLGFSGSIGSWAAGLLFDIVNIDGNDLRYANLEQFQFGTGWNTANSMFWQCTASTIECYSPDADDRSSAHGCWGTLTGNGEWTSSNDHVAPRSLFYDQLERRLGQTIPSLPTDTGTIPASCILPRPTNATSSPTVEQAMAMAYESLTEPRLTMEMWIDSIDLRSSLNEIPAMRMKLEKGAAKKAQETVPAKQPAIQITAGHLTVDGQLLTGNQYNIPWWSGRVKDNFVRSEAKPAVTRFVPGREGTGWTDRVDSVVDHLSRRHFSSLDHHYGLWYDLRRTDHERIRRADGDVWAPFYEQPFARTGQGTAWDGLSRYDLTRPNRWYWLRLNDFATKSAGKGVLLFNEHYFQHNILEAGAHWVDCPWRPVNNVNGTTFPEPVPFAGDKRIFLAEQFYNVQDTVLRPLHRQYIRMCLEQLKDQPNVVHLVSAEYTGPLHFTRFWLETIAEWEAESGRHPIVALSCTKDAQDSILADPRLSRVVDLIDIRYWHYNTDGLWAPEAGRNMAPRQWMRKMKVGKTGFAEAYRAVREYRQRYPDKAVTFFAQQYPDYGWAILMAGGSLPNVPIYPSSDTPLQRRFLADVSRMSVADGCEGGVALGHETVGYVVYTQRGSVSLNVAPGRYDIYTVDTQTGTITLAQKAATLPAAFTVDDSRPNRVYWLCRQ